MRDRDPRLPVLDRDMSTEAHHGRGLALGERWGVQPHPNDGKDVWLELRLETSR
jgi:hypothetical protein